MSKYDVYLDEWVRLHFEEGQSLRSIAKKFGMKNNSTISRLFEKNGIKPNNTRKKYSCDENFFEKIDSYEKAYWLGFIYADGCVNYGGKDRMRYRLSIELKESDEGHLKLFQKSIGSDHNLQKIRERKSIALQIYSKKLCEDLIEHGVSERKSMTATFPKWLNPKFYKPFILGLLDGDGSIGINTYGRYFFEILGTKDIVENIQAILIKNCNLPKIKIYEKSSIFKVQYGGNREVKRILDWLYGGSKIYLERKHSIYKGMI